METIRQALAGAHGPEIKQIATHLSESISQMLMALRFAAETEGGDPEIGLQLMQDFMQEFLRSVTTEVAGLEPESINASVDQSVLDYADAFIASKDQQEADLATHMAAISSATALHNKRTREKSGVLKKIANDKSGKHSAMNLIQREWTRRKDAGHKFKAVEFAREMAKEHKDVVTVEAIKNAQTRWNKEYHPAS